MMKFDPYLKVHSRLRSGRYVMNKLACAGMLLLILMLLSWVMPLDDHFWSGSVTGLAIPLDYWVYGYAMTASIAADVILVMLPSLSRMKQASLYAAAGFVMFYSLYTQAAEPGSRDLAEAAGMITVLFFYIGKRLFPADSLFTPLFALIVPLLCWSLL